MIAPGLALVTALWAAPSEAVAVVPILVDGPHGEASLSSVLADVAAAAAYRPRLRIMSSEEVFAAGSGKLSEELDGCGADATCLARRLRALGANHGLVVVVNRLLAPPLVALRWIDTDSQEVVGTAAGPITPDEASVSAAVRARAALLFDRAGFLQLARLAVVTQPPGARIELEALDEGEAPPMLSGSVLLEPGRYRVRAFDDARSVEEEVTLVAGEQRQLSLTLPEPSPSIFASPWFWGAVGVAVAAGTAAAVVASSSGRSCVCVAPPGVTCPGC